MTATLSFGQNCYPQRVVISGDTLVAFSQEQSDDLLQIYLHREKLVQEAKLKDSLILLRDFHISQQDSSIQKLQNLLALSETAMDNYSQIISNKDAELSLQQKRFRKQKINNFFRLGTTNLISILSTYLIIKLK